MCLKEGRDVEGRGGGRGGGAGGMCLKEGE